MSTNPGQIASSRLQSAAVALEMVLILGGLVALFLLPNQAIRGDAKARFEAVTQLVESGTLSDMHYSIVGPLFSVPFYLLGKLWQTPRWWCERYNFLLFAGGLAAFGLLLRNRVDRGLLRKFLLLLVAASMFASHACNYYGETFTAVTVAVGVLCVAAGRWLPGWCLIVLGVANQPACVLGLALVCAYYAVTQRRWRFLLPLLAAGGVILLEAWVRRGHPFATGYEHSVGVRTFMPYSGRPGFSYPFFFGLISILLSFGKGLVFFAPGLLLLPGQRAGLLSRRVRTALKLWCLFLGGMVLVYGKWWAWYGGWCWGPRFFLLASVPACFLLAVRLHYRDGSIAAGVVALSVLALSVWVGVSGVVFGQRGLGLGGATDLALEPAVWYVPEFSVLWSPFLDATPLNLRQAILIAYGVLVFSYLSAPLLMALVAKTLQSGRELARTHLRPSQWRF